MRYGEFLRKTEQFLWCTRNCEKIGCKSRIFCGLNAVLIIGYDCGMADEAKIQYHIERVFIMAKKIKKGQKMLLCGFTGVRLARVEVAEVDEDTVTIYKKNGEEMIFDKKTLVQTNAKKERYANTLVEDDPSWEHNAVPTRKSKKEKPAPVEIYDGDEEDEEDEEDKPVKPYKKSKASKSKPAKKPAKKAVVEEDEDDEEEFDDDDEEL